MNKSTDNIKKSKKEYRRLTRTLRLKMEALYNKKVPVKNIAKEIDVHTILLIGMFIKILKILNKKKMIKNI